MQTEELELQDSELEVIVGGLGVDVDLNRVINPQPSSIEASIE